MKPVRSGPKSDADQDRVERRAVAERVLHLLAEDDAASAPAGVIRSLPARARPAPRTRPRGSGARSARAARPACRTRRPAARDDDDRVAQRRHFLHHVAREQHAAALGAQAADDVAHRARAHDVEPVGRLVEQHVARDRARARAPAPPWSAHRARSPGVRRSAILRHVERLQQLRRARLAARRRTALQLAVVLDVLARRQPRIQARHVRQHAEPRLRPLRLGHGIHVVDRDRARVRPHQRVEHPQRRRLAGAVRPEQARDRAVSAVKLTPSTAVTVPKRFRRFVDADHCAAIPVAGRDPARPATGRTAAASATAGNSYSRPRRCRAR